VEDRAVRRGPGRPATGVTPKRNIRVGKIWDDAAVIAAERGETMSDVVVPILERELRRYVERYGAETGDPRPM